MMAQHEIVRDRIKAYEIGSSFFLLGCILDGMDIIKDTDPNHYQISCVQAERIHTSLANSLQSFESTILSFSEFQKNSSEAVNISIISFLARYPDLKDFLIFGRFSSGVIAMAISHLPDNIVYDQKIVGIAIKYGIPIETIEDLLRRRYELDSSVFQNKFDQICNDMANKNDNMIDKSIHIRDIIGSVISTEKVNGDISLSNVNNVFFSDSKQTLAEAADEIQKLLKQLEETNPSATEPQKVAYIDIVARPDLKQRTIADLKEGGETAIEEFFLENKYLKVVKAVIKGWWQATP
jgi:hypothetical protein